MPLDVANFGPVAADEPVYGACRPGHLGGDLDAWAAILESAGVTEVVCLLSSGEARRWGLPDAYADLFEPHHIPIVDRNLPAEDALHSAIDTIESTVERGNHVALHCNAGLGRTGIVGAGWLVHRHDLDPNTALETIEGAPRPRSPREAIRDDNATLEELQDLLSTLR